MLGRMLCGMRDSRPSGLGRLLKFRNNRRDFQFSSNATAAESELPLRLLELSQRVNLMEPCQAVSGERKAAAMT